MALPTHTVIILLSSIVILSYLFNMISRKTNIPAVLLLIGTGIAIKYLSAYYGYVEQDVNKLVKILGAIGLIMIVLEAALDLDVNRKKIKLIRDSFLSATVIFAVSVTAITWLITYWLGENIRIAAVYAVPMSIISSAIVIPSTSHLPEDKKEFIIYESSFSDIIGIMIFNYLVMNSVLNISSIGMFAASTLLAILISVLASFMLLYILAKISIDLKFFLLFAMLALVYSAGELIHIPSLLIVLVFGLVLNNSALFLRGKLRNLASHERMEGILSLMKSITAETSFLIRTFFFILFGYSFQLSLLAEHEVLMLGTAIVFILLGVRYLYLRFILRSNLFPELFLMPRGLVTILLFYSIPAAQTKGNFSVGILFYVVVVTSLFMMAGLLFFKPKEGHDELAEVSEEAN